MPLRAAAARSQGARVLLFPGQGCQRVGMGEKLLGGERAGEARRLFESVDGALEMRLSKVMREGPEHELNRTENSQPAVLACSLAAFLLALPEGPPMVASAGHSLGEFACLVAAGALDLPEACKLVRKRGLLMQTAADAWNKRPMMAAVLNLPLSEALSIARQCPEQWTCEIACSNGPAQTVLSGCVDGVSWSVERAKTLLPKTRAVRLPVSAPFHTSVMRSAADAFAKELASVVLKRPNVPIVFNATGSSLEDPGAIKRALVDGITARVQWSECVQELGNLAPGSAAVEIGHSGLLRFGLPPTLVSGGNVAW